MLQLVDIYQGWLYTQSTLFYRPQIDPVYTIMLNMTINIERLVVGKHSIILSSGGGNNLQLCPFFVSLFTPSV